VSKHTCCNLCFKDFKREGYKAHLKEVNHVLCGKTSSAQWGHFWKEIDSLNETMDEEWQAKRKKEEKLKVLRGNSKTAKRLYKPRQRMAD